MNIVGCPSRALISIKLLMYKSGLLLTVIRRIDLETWHLSNKTLVYH